MRWLVKMKVPICCKGVILLLYTTHIRFVKLGPKDIIETSANKIQKMTSIYLDNIQSYDRTDLQK